MSAFKKSSLFKQTHVHLQQPTNHTLQTNHARGTRVYSRIGLRSRARFERNCAEYASADLAQIDFLERGGPQRDRRSLDPDGDGYACNWDPAPFRRAASNG